METLVMAVHVVAAIAIVVLVLLQQGKGADAGAAFGSGASQTMFGSGGTGNFLTKSTTIAAVIFFATSLTLAIFARQQTMGGFDDSGLPVMQESELLSEPPSDSDVPQIDTDNGAGATGSDIPDLPQGDDR